MRIIVNLNEHQAVSDFSATTAPQPFEFKSQDTIDFQIYFVLDGIVQDMGSGFALKFGMIKTGDASKTILAYQTVASYLTDPNGNVYYLMQVVMNTAEMESAIGTLPEIDCTIEIRYQQTGEIIHTLNISAIVFATILVETGVTPPGVGTGYPDASTIELLIRKGVANGYASLDPTAHVPVAELPVTLELVTNKGQPGGYPSLDSNTLIPAAEIPVDGSTIIATGGKLSAPFGGGDMQKSVYDVNNRGFVDHAALADNATSATLAATASALSTVPSSAPLSVVWGRDASGRQNLYAAPAAGIPEAPSDGNIYGRKSSAWAIIPAAGGGALLDAIGAKTTAAFLWPAIGVSVTVTVDDGTPFLQLQPGFLIYVGPNHGILEFQSSSAPNVINLIGNSQYAGPAAGTSIPAGAMVIAMGVQVIDADPNNTIAGAITMVTNDQAADTPFLPAVKRLVATDGSIVLDSTTTDLAIGIRATSSPALKPWQGFERWTNFDELSLENTNFAAASYGGGSLSLVDPYGRDATGKVLGSATLITGTATGNPYQALAYKIAGVPTEIQFVNGLGQLTLIVRAAMQSLGSSAAEYPTSFVQWGDGGNALGNGPGFIYSIGYGGGNHLNWLCYAGDFSNPTVAQDSGKAVDTSFHRFKIILSTDWKTWTYYIDDVQVAQIARAAVPTFQTPVTLRPQFLCEKNGSTAATYSFTVDWIYWQYLFIN